MRRRFTPSIHLALILLWAAGPLLKAGTYDYLPTNGLWFASGSWYPTGIPQQNGTAGMGDTANIFYGQTVNYSPTTTYQTIHGGAGTLNNAGTLIINNGAMIFIDTLLNNSGTVELGVSSPTPAQTTYYATNSAITGGGTFRLVNSESSLTGNSGSATIGSQTIEGVGSIVHFNALNLGGNLVNANVNNGNLGILYSTVNGGTLQASNGGLLSTWDTNINGSTVRALDGSSVNLSSRLNTSVMAGGTLATEGTGVIRLGGFTLNGVTTTGRVVVNDGATSQLGGSITNSGTITVGAASELVASSNLSLTGGGRIVLANPDSSFYGRSTALTLDGQSIEGQGAIRSFTSVQLGTNGVIESNTGGTLTVSYTTVYGGTLQARNGGLLSTWDTDLNGSTVKALDGSVVVLSSRLDTGKMTGGTLATEGTGSIQINNFTLNGVTNQGNLAIARGASGRLSGTLNNTGTLTVGTGATGGTVNSNGATLSGGGDVILQGPSRIDGALTNQDNTVTVRGAVSATGRLTNQGKLIVTAGNSLNALVDNQGYLRVDPGAAVTAYWQNQGLNVAGGVLSGGTFDIAGTLQVANTSQTIVTNAANLILDGTSSIVSHYGDTENALSKLATNTGGFALRNGRNFTTSGAFTNTGALTVGQGSTFKVNSTGTGVYTQSSGATVVNGTLTAGTFHLSGGTLSGVGTIDADLLVNGSLNPGNSPGTMTVDGDVTLASGSTLNLELLAPSPGSYDRFIVIGDLYMDGLLQFLSPGYVPKADDYFTSVLSWTGTLGFGSSFNIAGLNLGNGYGLVLNWNRNSLDLAVNRNPDAAVPEPATCLGVGAALIAVALCQRRRRA